MAELGEEDGCFKTLASLMGMDPTFEMIDDFSMVSENSRIQLGDLVENSLSLPLECPSVYKDSLVGREENNKQRKEKGKRRWAEGKPEGVVHVRARRGQATDRHSLAERVRREKINEKLRRLRVLVPGCYKEMAMTIMLDEIIKYVRSLQNQIEFLSMKLSVAAAQFDFNLSQIDLASGVNGHEAFQIEEMNMNEQMMRGCHDFGYIEQAIRF